MAWIKTEKTGSLNALSDVNITSPADGNSLVYDEATGKWINGEGGGGNANEMVLTQDEYDALTPEEQLNGTNYYINNASVGAQSAAGTPYDNSLSDLLATDVQDAIDELVIGKVDAVNGKGLSTEDYTTAEKTKLGNLEAQIQVNWNETDTTSKAYINNKPTIPTSIGNLTDVDITSIPPAEGQALVWDGTMNKWVPGNVGGGLSTNQVRLRITEYTIPEEG